MALANTKQNTIVFAPTAVEAAGSVVFSDVLGHGSLNVVLQGTFNLSQAIFEGTIDNTNWFSIGAALATGGGTFGPLTGGVILAAESSAYLLPIAAGIASVRLRVTTFTSGTMNVSAVAAGGSLSVQTAASAVSGGDGAVVDGIDATIRATVFDYANSNPLAVTLRDTNGDTVGSGGTQYVETGYSPAATPATGTVALCRNLAGGLVPIPVGETGLLSCEIQEATVHVAASGGTVFAPLNFDADTGAGFAIITALGIALPANGGPVMGGTSTNPIRTDPTGTTVQPISATALPLPTGAATGAKQDTAQTSLSQIVSATSDALVALSDINVSLISTTATTARQDAGNASLSSIDTKLTSQATAAKQDALLAELQLKADLTETQPVSLASIPINAAASTAALQTSGNASLTTIAALSKAEDAAAVDGDTGIPLLAVRADVPLSTSGVTGDYNWMATDAQGRLWVNSDVLGELTKRSNDLLLTSARLASEQLRFQSMMAGGFVPVPEVW